MPSEMGVLALSLYGNHLQVAGSVGTQCLQWEEVPC
jgi:hypothetical protein